MANEATTTNPENATTATGDVMTLRVKVTRRDNRRLRHLALDQERTVQDLLHEAVERLLVYYMAQGIPARNREDACDV